MTSFYNTQLFNQGTTCTYRRYVFWLGFFLHIPAAVHVT